MTQNSVRPLLQGVLNRAAASLVPLQAALEVTHRCNLSCKHCYIDVPVEEELSLSEIKDILDQLAEAGSMYLCITGGEALVRHDFFNIASYARERDFVITLLTNGTLITPAVAGELKRLEPSSVGMSLYGATPATHDGVTGKQGSFRATIRAVELLKGLGVIVNLQIMLMELNVHEAEAMESLVQELDVHHQFSHSLVPGRSGSLAPFQYECDSAGLCRYLGSDIMANVGNASGKVQICQAGRGACSISPTGDVYPCLLMPMKLGNLRKNRFDEIWRTSPIPELTYLRSITEQDLAECRDCSLLKYCKRCMGVSFSETGELTKPAPSTCRNAALEAEFFKRKGVIL